MKGIIHLYLPNLPHQPPHPLTHPLSYTVCTTSDITAAVKTVAQNPTVLGSYHSYIAKIFIKH